MEESPARLLSRGNTVLALKPARARSHGNDLPSPVLYLGLVTLSGHPPSAVTSDAFKREVCDIDGTKHQLTDATIATYYDEVTGEDRDELIDRFWQEQSVAARKE